MEEAGIFVTTSLGCLLLELHIAEVMLASRFFFKLPEVGHVWMVM